MNRLAWLVLFSCFTLIPTTAITRAQECGFQAVTMASEGTSFSPSVNDRGNRISFHSNADLLGTNSDGLFEIFLYDMDSDSLMQLTDSATHSSASNEIDGSGTKVVYHSRVDLDGGNADGSLEIFLFDTTTMSSTQITSSDLDSAIPILSADATKMVFVSDADFAGGNPDSSREVFLLSFASGEIDQVTDSLVFDIPFANISDDGSTVVFYSEEDLTGQNPDGDLVIFVYDVVPGTLRQVTEKFAEPGGTTRLSLSGDGGLLTFSSEENLTGENPIGADEIFLLDLKSDILRQVTFLQDSTGAPGISYDGRTISFTSTSLFGGNNPEANIEMFQLTVSTGEIRQLTSVSLGSAQLPSLSGDGRTIATFSFGNYDGTNEDQSWEIFVRPFCGLFVGDFESGDTSRWSDAVP